jgi:quercetin dioxygenase-like cupin family protein
MRFAIFGAVQLLASFAVATLPAAADSRTLLENDKVRVVRANDQPHAPSAPHDHKFNRVMIYLQPGTERFTTQNGAPTTLKWRAGEAKWSPAGGTHISEVVSNAPVTMIEVEIKREGDPSKKVSTALDPANVDPKDYRVEFENSQVRVLRVLMPPKHAVPLHEHQLDRVVVYLTDQNTRVTTPDGKAETVQHKAGEASWGGPAKHREENLNDAPFEAVVVELKN